MPIHLGPITRREFLVRSAAAGAAALLPRAAYALAAGSTGADPHSFVLMSDTHITVDPRTKRLGINMAEHFAKAATEIAALKVKPSGVIHTGDCAHTKGLAGEYVQFGQILSRIVRAKIPVHLGMGNHDHRGNFYRVLKSHRPRRTLVTGKHVAVIESRRANWFLLDSLEKVNAAPGSVGATQIEWLAKALDARADKPAIVLAHHHPQFKTKIGIGLKDTDALFEVLTGRRHVKAYVYGHRHQWRRGVHEGLHLINVPAVAYPFGRGQPSGWVHAQLKPDGMVLELRSINPKHKAHGQKVNLKWRA